MVVTVNKRNSETKRTKGPIDDPALNYIIQDLADTNSANYNVSSNVINQQWLPSSDSPKIYESVQKALVIALNYCLITQLNNLISLYQPTRRLEGLLVVLGVLTFVTSIIETTRGRNMLIGFLLLMNFIISANKK